MAIHIRRREFIVALGGVATVRAALTVSGPALGQDYPNRQITTLVGIAAGGITDVTTRQYAALLSKNLDQNVIVENRPVAGGAVAAAAVQGAAPDGYTLLSAVGSQFCSVPAMGPAPYDPVKGFAPISLTFRLPTLLIVPIDSPAKTVAELFAWGKTKPGGLLLGSPGPGTPGHLLGAKIALATNTPIQYVHYRGGAPIMADLITGRLDFSLATFNSARSNMDAKKLRALAVDAETRLPALPDIPTLIEAGLGAYRVADWAGVLAPAGTPADIVDRLNREFVIAAHTPDLIAKAASVLLPQSGSLGRCRLIRCSALVRLWQILLQKSKNCPVIVLPPQDDPTDDRRSMWPQSRYRGRQRVYLQAMRHTVIVALS